MLAVVKVLALNEVRLRLRRTSTLVAVLGVAMLSWLMIGDPASGSAVLVIRDARVLYTSAVLAIGSASLAALVLGLGGFYLVRGRMAEDVRSGAGSVIGATPVGNALFLIGRWVGGVAYLSGLLVAFMCTVLVLHAVRGEGLPDPLVYLQYYALLLMPMVLFAVSCAILFDSVAPLMGKAGDILYFVVWCAQLGIMIAGTSGSSVVPSFVVFDFSGMATCMLLIKQGVATADVALGGATFNAALAPIHLTTAVWSAKLAGLRLVSGLLALLPLLPAILLFHRFSPDQVKASRASARRSPLAVLDALLRPLAALARPLFGLAAAIPGLAGRMLGDVALTLVVSPTAVAALMVSMAAALLVPGQGLGIVLGCALLAWGVIVCDISTRDFTADTEGMTGTAPGGAIERYLRQFGATAFLGFLFMGIVALRWAAYQPLRAAAVVAGIACLSALATLFGRSSRTSRLFLALFLFAVYIAANVKHIALLDLVGFQGSANAVSVAAYLLTGVLALAAGYLWNRRQSL